MRSFLTSCRRICAGLYHAWQEPDFRNQVILLLLLVLVGTVFFRLVEGWSWVDSVYFCVTTLNMLGYGDVVPKTDLGKIASIIYSLVSIALFLRILQWLLTPIDRSGSEARRNGPEG